ncbi:baseplate J/gp47 family protein [Pseudotenacibaculum haliotis]|uniref:Baseplate J/gp47 family protein n=1 Tax=Pseudotenacibaculum haliotis TaxID=1862138 RepID=A0ABW5LSP1_9FLAO
MGQEIDKILKRSGTDQNDRFIEALKPENFELHDFTLEDWILFAYNFAKRVNYFDISDDKKPSDDWQSFFQEFNPNNQEIVSRTTREYGKLKQAIDKTLSEYKENSELTPHLTLFVCFLQLLEFSKERFNKLTKRHLDFYYKEVLQVNQRAAISDQVHILFEIARRSSEEQVVEATELDAGKDDNGVQRIYNTTEELIANKAQVASVRSIYNGEKFSDPKHKGDNPLEFVANEVANTLDGKEEPLPEDAPYWFPFGYTSEISEQGTYKELENANIGFAISSPMLLLEEGLRTIEITIDFEEETTEDDLKLSDFKADVLEDIISIYGSGAEDWIGPLQLKITANEADKASEELITKDATEKQLKLVFQLTKDEDALVHYNDEFLLKKYATDFPLVRFLIDTSEKKGYEFYKILSEKVVTNVTVKVDVKEATTIITENDNGILKTAKPFYPFSTQPVLNSNFYIDFPEAFSKKWTSIKVNFKWKNTPKSFKDWYKAYLDSQRLATNKTTFLQQMTSATDNELIVKSDSHFKAEKAIKHNEIWKVKSDKQTLFTKIVDPNTQLATDDFECTVEYTNSESFAADTSGPLRLSLENTFLHSLYPRIYAMALTSKGAPLVPNEPYTPIAEELSISYVAQESLLVKSQETPISKDNPLQTQNSKESYEKNRIKLFHEHPFGQNEEHNYLKLFRREKGIRDLYDSETIEAFLVPKYCKGGELLIGLEEAEPLQNISLLIQVLEGSENPLVKSFENEEQIEWSVLCSNGWKSLKEHIISDSTENMLSSGIIKIGLPNEASLDNTLLPENYIWLRAKLHKSYDAVCKVINIHTQAVLAEFKNSENELSHLEKGLESETIKKLIDRVPQIRSVSQPYSSFNGLPEESDLDFYRRISERLRHKNRAITLWDYEHLILQKFPEIYKVKCLNHTSEKSFTAAGEVSLVVIPDTVNKNVFDIYEPRVSKGLLAKVEKYINTLNTKHVEAKVINPNYEQVFVKLQAQFYEGLDKNFYSKKLEEDITKFLSPWAYDDTKEITFGVTLHKSVLIDYLEKLEYVDYLQNVEISKVGSSEKTNNISPSDPKSILVSAKDHDVSTVLSNCKGEKFEEPKTCQV